MAFPGHLSKPELDAVEDAIFQATQYPTAARQAMLRGLPIQLIGMMDGNQPPIFGIGNDLSFLNNIERLTDGTVPLLTFMRNAARLAGTMESMQPVREAIAQLEQATSGAPPVNVAQFPEIKERITGGHNDMVPLAYLAEGLKAATSVAKLEVPRWDNGIEHKTRGEQTIYLGTGWIVAPGLLLTNHHVFNARNDREPPASADDFDRQARATRVLFDYDVRGVASPPPVGVVEVVDADVTLDFALAKLTDDGRPALRIAQEPPSLAANGDPLPVNIIQHPNGHPKQYGIRNNLVTSISETDIRYFTDTDGGSSGSPVLNDNWEVVGLHRGSAYVKDVQFQGRSEAYVNLGTRIDKILAVIEDRRPGLIHI